MKSNPNKNTAKSNPEEEYDNLLQEFQEMNQPQETMQNGDITSLKGRAKQLLVWITLHKNHVDRHELADICKEGMELIKKILKSTNNADISELDFELMVMEARKTACEKAFAEDLKGFDNITPDIICSLLPKDQVSIKTRISQAKSNIYLTTDTPEGILDEIRDMHDKVMESRVDDILSQAGYTSPHYSHLREHICQEELREYIMERIDYMNPSELTCKVIRIITEMNTAIRCYRLTLPCDLEELIKQYNTCVADLERYGYNDRNKYKELRLSEMYFSTWHLESFHSEIESDLQRYVKDLEEMGNIVQNMERSRQNIIERLHWFISECKKKQHITQLDWDNSINRLKAIYDELNQSRCSSYKSNDMCFSQYYDEVERIISHIS